MRTTLLFLSLLILTPVASAEPAADRLERDFHATIRPFLQAHCLECHNADLKRGRLDLSVYRTMDAVIADERRWKAVLEQLQANAMPPEKAQAQPTEQQRRDVVQWLQTLRRREAVRTAGDPGIVPTRRLSNAEYDHTIRDLTGVDIRPTREFPIDPANEAGFDNSAESLTMSAALLKKYLEAARYVADHLVLKPEGFTFAPHPALTDTDRDKFSVRRIIDFYQRHRIDLADYFRAAWRYQHRQALGFPKATLDDVAHQEKISPKYLTTVWTVLTTTRDEVGPLAALRELWKELPGSDADSVTVRNGCEQMRDFVVGVRQQLVPEVKNLTAPGIHNGSQCFVLWKNRQFAANRRRYVGGALGLKNLDLRPNSPAARAMSVPTEKADVERYETTFHRFCDVFPDAFVVSERARVYLNPEQEKKLGGRLLSAGFHSMTGYFRDDAPLYDLVLDREGQRELDRLWQEFDFVTGAPMRQHTSFLWFERTDSTWMRDPEFDPFRAEDKDSTSEEKIRKLSEVYLAKARERGAGDVALEAIRVHFKNINASIRWVEQARRAAEPSHLVELQAFAERAYRRPLSKIDRDDGVAFYRELRQQQGLSHEDAIRDSIVRVLMSPHFCYRLDLRAEGSDVRPLSDHALASRLSYFLWSSMPDAELLQLAAASELRRPEVLRAQVRRMLRDERIRGLATEFAGNWLDFRRFEEHNSVDRERFPAFTDELRQAMFEEPIRFFLDVVRENRPVHEFLYAKHTFVNPVLARHYGMPEPTTGDWQRIDDADRYGRGGLLPMAVFLTKNSPGLRTSPVKRGYWVVRRLLGETIPAPPTAVPELPEDEAKLGELTLREALSRHRADKSCAGCHQRFDSLGLVFEGYGPVGEQRTKDLGGRPVETRAEFPNGGEGAGLEGLRDYLRERRQDEFVENLCRKLLAYALGRSLQLSDEPTIEEMQKKLLSSGGRVGTIVEMIVASPQFLNQRGSAAPKGERP